jgi:endonuclease YncB( thermonuclease family)
VLRDVSVNGQDVGEALISAGVARAYAVGAGVKGTTDAGAPSVSGLWALLAMYGSSISKGRI